MSVFDKCSRCGGFENIDGDNECRCRATSPTQTDASRWEEELREASEHFVTHEADGCETLQACFEAGARWMYSEAFAQVAAEAREAALEEAGDVAERYSGRFDVEKHVRALKSPSKKPK